MKNKALLAVLLVSWTLCLPACGENYASESERQKAMNPELENAEMKRSSSSEEKDINKALPRKLIWTANLEFQVKNVDASTSTIKALSKKYGGFISNMLLENNNYRVTNTITLRVDNVNFNAFIDAVKKESIFTVRSDLRSNDVTEEFVDLESRLSTKRKVRDRYIEILRTRTGTIEDVLAAEEAIRKITEEIEAKEGRLRYLSDKVSMSTVHLEIYETVDFKEEPDRYTKTYAEEMGDSFGKGWSAIKGLLLGFISIWPLLIVLIVVLWKRKWIAKKLKGTTNH